MTWAAGPPKRLLPADLFIYGLTGLPPSALPPWTERDTAMVLAWRKVTADPAARRTGSPQHNASPASASPATLPDDPSFGG